VDKNDRWAVFVHGCFWHSHSCYKWRLPKINRPFWRKKFQQKQARDQRCIRQLRSKGTRTLVIWECQLDHLSKVENRLIGFIGKELPRADAAELCSTRWIKSTEWPKQPFGDARLAIADLFSGCGGLTLGAYEAARINNRRLDIRLAADFNDAALNVYRDNFGVDETTARKLDLQSALLPYGSSASTGETKLIDLVGALDLLIAGPPCQGNSDLNNSTRRNDPRNRLYAKMLRAAELFRPRAMIIENVPTVIHDTSRIVDEVKRGLVELGYCVTTSIVDVSRIGVPQRRKRHVLVATLVASLDVETLFKSLDRPETPIASYLDDLQTSTPKSLFDTPSKMTRKNQTRAQYLIEKDKYDLPNRLRPKCHQSEHSYVSMYGRLSWSLPAQTITSGFGCMGQGRFVHPKAPRVLTPHEAARLQGFPDFFSFSTVTYRTALHEMIGNAVPPKVCAVLVNALIRHGLL